MKQIKKANKLKCFLLKSINGNFFIREYKKDKTFIDMEICHYDLEITINDKSAVIYKHKNKYIIDYSPQVLGRKK